MWCVLQSRVESSSKQMHWFSISWWMQHFKLITNVSWYLHIFVQAYNNHLTKRIRLPSTIFNIYSRRVWFQIPIIIQIWLKSKLNTRFIRFWIWNQIRLYQPNPKKTWFQNQIINVVQIGLKSIGFQILDSESLLSCSNPHLSRVFKFNSNPIP